MITKWRHAGMCVVDMDQTLAFYCGLLKLKPLCDLIEEGEYLGKLVGVPGASIRCVKAVCPDGVVIELMQFVKPGWHERDQSGFNVRGPNHLAFSVTDIGGLYRELSGKGVKFISEPLSSPYDPVKTCFCYDPDGNFVQFVEVPDKAKMREGLE